MAWRAAAVLAFGVTLALSPASRDASAQPANAAPPREVTYTPDWQAVRAQLAARSDTKLRRGSRSFRDLVPPQFRAGRSYSGQPSVPVLLPMFAGGDGPGGAARSNTGGARNYLPISQAPSNSTGARSLTPVEPAAEQPPETTVFPAGDSYSATIRLPQDAEVTISGSRRAIELAQSDPAAWLAPRAGAPQVGRYQMYDVTIERTETGHSISFTRFKVAYNIEIGCTAPFDPRCADPDFVQQLAFSMGLFSDPPQ